MFWIVQINYTELSRFSEVLACGTGVAVVPIRSISRQSTSDRFVYLEHDSEPGPCAKLLADMLSNIYKGTVEDRFWWLFKVKEPNLKTVSDAQLKPGHGQANENGKVNGDVELDHK